MFTVLPRGMATSISRPATPSARTDWRFRLMKRYFTLLICRLSIFQPRDDGKYALTRLMVINSVAGIVLPISVPAFRMDFAWIIGVMCSAVVLTGSLFCHHRAGLLAKYRYLNGSPIVPSVVRKMMNCLLPLPVPCTIFVSIPGGRSTSVGCASQSVRACCPPGIRSVLTKPSSPEISAAVFFSAPSKLSSPDNVRRDVESEIEMA